MKSCIACGKRKSIGHFYAHPRMADGHLNKCKECCKTQARANRANNLDYYRAYDRARADMPQRVSAREKYIQSEAGKMSHAEASRRWDENNRIARAAHLLVSRAIKSGRLIRPSACSSCGAGCVPHAHHDDYTKPLRVRWLCPKCHYDLHKKRRGH